MLDTVQPPNVDGMVIAPAVAFDTAGESEDPLYTLAVQSLIVYVHVTPSTTSVNAKLVHDTRIVAIIIMICFFATIAQTSPF
jgi:hypothetical protein